MKILLPLACLLVAFPASAAHNHPAHVHGIAKLEVAVDGNTLSLHLESPLEGLLGFEHAPGNDKELAVVADMRKKLAAAASLFNPGTAARCTLKSVKVEAPTLDAKPAVGREAEHAAHGDLDADFVFICAQPARLSGMEVRLFEAFPKMRQVDVQVVSAKGQKALRLSSKMRFLSW